MLRASCPEVVVNDGGSYVDAHDVKSIVTPIYEDGFSISQSCDESK
jgi:hypothetical protein